MAVEPFLWGRAGAKLTPEQIAMEREAADALAKGAMDYSPVGHWSQGLSRVAQGLLAGLDYRTANAAEDENATYNTDIINSLLGGSPTAAMPSTTGVGAELAATSPTVAQPLDMSGNEVYGQFIDTVKQGGVQNPYALAAIAATGKAESGFDPKNATRTWSDPSESGQPGTAGGIMSWRGPRYQALAATGDLSPAGQAKFFLQENPQLIQSLNSAKSVEEAQSLMNNAWKFAGYDRPGGEASRRLQLASSFLPSFQNTEVAAASPQAAIEAVAPASGYVDPMVSAPNAQPSAQTALAPELPAPVEVSAPPAVAAVPQQQVAQAMAAPATPAINPAIVRALTDPRASSQTRAVAQMLMQQEARKQEAAQEQQTWMARQQYEQQQQASDPLRQLQIRKAQMEIDSANQPKRQPLMNAGNGAIYDPNNDSWIQAPGGGEKLPDSVRALELRAERAGLKPGTPEYNQFMLSGGSGGMSISVGPDGQFSFQQGGPVKPLTEAQSKDSFFTTRMTGAVPTIDKFENALMSLPESVAGAIPMNLGRYAQSEEYQLAKDAGDDFVAAYLRKDSGAALTEEEKRQYSELLLPQPSDKPALIAAKRQRRRLAIEAIKSGMPSNAVDGVLRAIEAVPGADEPAKTTDEIQTDIPGVKIRRKN